MAQAVLNGLTSDPTGGCDHYYNPRVVQPRWARGKTRKIRIGGHDFFDNID